MLECSSPAARTTARGFILLRLRDLRGMRATVCPMDGDKLLTTAEVARHFKVDASAVRRWVDAGKLTPAITTPGGHYRFTKHDIDKLGRVVP